MKEKNCLKKKCDKEMALRQKEIEIKKKEQQEKGSEFDVMFNQQQTLLQAMQQQQAQLSHTLHLIIAQQNKTIMSAGKSCVKALTVISIHMLRLTCYRFVY